MKKQETTYEFKSQITEKSMGVKFNHDFKEIGISEYRSGGEHQYILLTYDEFKNIIDAFNKETQKN